jgi:TIR domain
VNHDENCATLTTVGPRICESAKMGHEIYISHACKDKTIADAICKGLESSGVRCWIAPRDIPVGEDWVKAVRRAIEAAPLFVLVLSENANEAPHVEREIANAFYAGRKIVPIRVSNAIPSRGFLFYLSDSQCFDSIGESDEPDVKGVVERVKGLLGSLGLSSGNSVSSPSSMTGRTTLNNLDLRNTGSQNVAFALPTILRRSAVLASIVVAGGLVWWIGAQGADRTSDADYLRSAQGGESSPLSPKKKGESQPPQSYEFSRFGLWVPSTTSPTPRVQPPGLPSPSLEAQTADANSPQSSNLDQSETSGQQNLSDQEDPDAKFLSDNAAQTAGHRESHRRRRHRRATTEVMPFAMLKAYFREGIARFKERLSR